MASFEYLLRDVKNKTQAEEISAAAIIINKQVGSFSSKAPQQADQVDWVIKTDFFQNIRSLWREWTNTRRVSFTAKYGNLLQLVELPIDENMLRAAIHFWDSKRRCFNFNGIDLVPTIEEYQCLLGLPKDKKAVLFQPKPQKSCKRALAHFMGYGGLYRDAHNIVIQREGKELIPWESIRDAMHEATEDRVHSHIALAIYGLVIFPRVPDFIDGAVFELMDQVTKGANPVPAILGETIRSLSYLRTNGTDHLMGCLPLLSVWLRSHFPCKISKFRAAFSLPPTPLSDFMKSTWELPRSLAEWRRTFKTLREDDIIWMAPWMPRDDMIYSCGPYNWVPLLGPWGGTIYAPLQVGRQLTDHQILPVLFEMEKYDINKYGMGQAHSLMVRLYQAWSKPRIMKPGSDVIPEVTLSYIK